MKSFWAMSLFFLFALLFLTLDSCAAPVPAEDRPALPSQPTSAAVPTFSLIPTAEPSATPTPIPPTKTPAPTLVYEGEPTIGSFLIGEDGAKLLFAPAGEFLMGASADALMEACARFRSDCRREWFTNVQPPRKVTLDAFWIDETEVTNKMYQACVDAGKCEPPFRSSSYRRPSYFGNVRYENYPVVYVSWYQAQAYCEYAGRRLPTEAEWEKAARGTDGRLFVWGERPPTLTYSNFGLLTGDTTAVKNYAAGKSFYGAFDMSGNVWEWVADWYDENYYKTAPSVNPLGPESGEMKVSRGGAWISNDFDMFVTDRYGNLPKTTNNAIGFRCARSR